MDNIDLFFGKEANESWHLFLSNNTLLPIVVENIGLTVENPKYRIERDSSSSLIVIEYVLSGEGFLEINDTKYQLKAEDIYIIPPYLKHKYYSSEHNPLKKVWINFRSAMFENIIKNLNLDSMIVFENEHNVGKLFFDQVFAISETSNYSDDICYSLCPLIFSLLCSLSEHRANVQAKHVSIIAQEIKRVLDDSLDSNISLDEVSNQLHYSKKQIAREFESNYNITPHQYLIQEKMKAAQTYLTATNLSIKEIAFRLGFESQHYFSNAFKKRYGLSPLEYKTKKLIDSQK